MPVVVSQTSGVQLLGVPKISTASGKEMADAVFTTINDWNIKANIVGVSFDITNSNSGQYGGAVVILERLFGRNLLKLACRHHLYEIILRGAYEACFDATSGPSPSMFDRFESQWNNIDQSQYEPGIRNEYIWNNLQEDSEDIIEFCQAELKKNIVRDDYKELLELTVIFLGVDYFPRNVHFRSPCKVDVESNIRPEDIYVFKRIFGFITRQNCSHAILLICGAVLCESLDTMYKCYGSPTTGFKFFEKNSCICCDR